MTSLNMYKCNVNVVLLLLSLINLTYQETPIPLAQEVHDLFNTMDTNPVPLYYCRSWNSGILWKIPPPH